MLKTLNIENFTCFPKAELEFSKGLNVIVGENGTGKSHLLKLGYAVLQTLVELKHIKRDFGGLASDFLKVLEPIFNIKHPLPLINKANYDEGTIINTSFLQKGMMHLIFEEAKSNHPNITMKDCTNFNSGNCVYEEINFTPLFFPAKEIMSVYKGFRSTLKNRELGFDKTYENFAEALDVALLKNIVNESVKNSIELLEKSINNYTVEYDSKTFYFRKKTNKPNSQSNIVVPASLFAEGHNKLGTLSYLMRNGSIQEGMTLFWDEPEANMNPRLLKVLAEVLVDMSSYMQIVLSTHSLFLLRELDIISKEKEITHSIMFTGLHLQEDQSVQVVQSKKIKEIGDITALDAALEQSERFMQSRGK